MSRPQITAHMIVKNEDQWVWYAIRSVLPYVDRFLITDTGSTDRTIELIKGITSPKIVFSESHIRTPSDMTRLRNQQLQASTSDWIWLVDGDEIYPASTAREVVRTVETKGIKCITLRRHDLLGDLYHAQVESVGSYEIYGEKGHLATRLFNIPKLSKLRVVNDYPLEEYVYEAGLSTSDLDLSEVYITSHSLYHTMYLKRSSLGASIINMFNRHKFKIETGIHLSGEIPQVFSLQPPLPMLHPLRRRGLGYNLLASLITPIKNLKRRLI